VLTTNSHKLHPRTTSSSESYCKFVESVVFSTVLCQALPRNITLALYDGQVKMDDLTSTFEWKSHIVLACITCGKVILLTRTDKDRKAARRAYEIIIRLTTTPNPRKFDDRPINLFLPTVCSSCDGAASWTSLSINRSLMQTWQPYRAMNAFLEGDLSMLGSPISLVRR
jgi:hypothetical protein